MNVRYKNSLLHTIEGNVYALFGYMFSAPLVKLWMEYILNL